MVGVGGRFHLQSLGTVWTDVPYQFDEKVKNRFENITKIFIILNNPARCSRTDLCLLLTVQYFENNLTSN